jgi:two-component system, OmpR family, copper resistance phosphate regulon response regulator CusR
VESGGGSGGGSGFRVLVIEDETRIAQFMTDTLRDDGCDVLVAEDGDVGFFLAESEPFDVVVLDALVPAASVLSMLSALRTARPGLPVIVLTPDGDPQLNQQITEAGASRLLPRPLVLADFRTAVRDQLGAAPRP